MHASGQTGLRRALKSGFALWLATSLVMLGSTASATAAADEPEAKPEREYSGSSWGLGVVVPEGASLAGGGVLSWSSVTSVTALVKIPNILNATRTTYAILSVMTEDGSVLQVAAGTYPGNRAWLVYAMSIAEAGACSQNYRWATNSSAPEMLPGQSVVLFVFLSQDKGWCFGIRDLSTGASVEGPFGAKASRSLRAGDQEVFALESYSGNEDMFEEMGNLTLVSLYAGRTPVTGGWYLFADWDARHGLLFVVGGVPPPQFIAFRRAANGTSYWYFVEDWSSRWQPPDAGLFIAVGMIGAVSLAVYFARGRVRKAPAGGDVDRRPA